jgi:hypothetical protein
MLETAFGENATGKTLAFEGVSRSKLPKTSAENCDISGRTSIGLTEEKVDTVHKIFNED